MILSLLLPGGVAAQSASRPGTLARRTGTFKDARLLESSGVVASRRHPGHLWTMNDSGGDAVLFLTDTAGRALARFSVPGAVNVDWEALGRGPCGGRGRECLYIGDTGDNGENRRRVRLYRVPEPEPAAWRPRGATGRAEALEVTYPDRPHDVEALYVEPDGSVVLITKGRRYGVLVFRVPAAAWQGRGPVLARRADSLPIPAGIVNGRVVTDAALSPDGKVVAVRTYRDIRFFARDETGRLRPDPARPVCDIAGEEPQGEGIDWLDRETLVLTSERGLFRAGTITLVRCPSR
ncbi:MAG TPA: hypothetical protein VGQ17_13265 [Gemmatimonadales bacterium]|nr:hypothetical protein [Gemmatimonadales bacterium]